MRVCLVTREYAPFFGGGIGTYAALMGRALLQSGHEVHVLTLPHPGLSRAAELAPGVRFHTVDLERGPASREAYPYPQMRHAMGVHGSLEPLHREHRFDLIEFPDFWGEGHFALQAKRTQGKYAEAVLAVRLHTPHRDVRELNRVGWLDAEAAYLDHQEEASIRAADLVLSPTRALLDRIESRLGPLRRSQVHRHPLSPDWMAAPTETPTRRSNEVLFLGRLEHRKGVHLLVEAGQALLRRGVEVHFRFIGGDTDTGPFGRSMKSYLASKLEARDRPFFHFDDALPRAELPSLLAQATVCCFPSLWENFPYVCLEAMSAGAPVLGSDAGGMAEIIADGVNGLLFRSGDSQALARGLERLLGSPSLRQQLGARAPDRVRELCDPATLVEELEALLDAPLAAPRIRRRAAKKGPAVSFLVPHFNMGRYLPEALESIRRQSFTSHEVLVIDDGSTDALSLDVLEQEERRGVTVLRQRHAGVSAARNRGLAQARGKWVLPLDPDDLIAPEFLKTMVEAFERDSSLTYATSLSSFFVDDPSVPIGGWVPWGAARNAMAVINVASTCTALMLRSKVEEAGGYDEWMTAYEDWDLFCSLVERGARGAVVPEFLFHYRVRPDSLMRTVVASHRYRLLASLIEKHPALATEADIPLRMLLAEASRLDDAPNGVQEAVPLRYRAVDGLNAALKRLPGLQPLLKRLLALRG